MMILKEKIGSVSGSVYERKGIDMLSTQKTTSLKINMNATMIKNMVELHKPGQKKGEIIKNDQWITLQEVAVRTLKLLMGAHIRTTMYNK